MSSFNDNIIFLHVEEYGGIDAVVEKAKVWTIGPPMITVLKKKI